MPSPLTTHLITGQWRRRKILLPQDDTVRPTRNMVLQAGFNLLEPRVDWANLRVADVCCGSGQWGLEALSRGAAHAIFVDVNTATVAANLRSLGATESTYTLLEQPLARASDSLTDLEVIFADPPYESDLYDLALSQPQWGKVGSYWLVETDGRHSLTLPAFLTLVSHKVYGKSALWLLEQTF